MKLDTKRWLILLAGILINFCQGTAYASSVFAKPMLIHLRCFTPTGVPDMSQWAIAWSINLACLPVGMILSGRLTDRGKGRLMILFGGTLFSLGMLFASFTSTLFWFCLTFGVMMGLGSGSAYGAVVSTTVRWFPDRRGLASGLAVGALGFGSFVIPWVGVWLMNHAPNQSEAVLFALKVLGTAFLAVIPLGSIIMAPPPHGYRPTGFDPKSHATRSHSREELTWSQMLLRGKFWLVYAAYACGTFAGLMFISQASPIAQSMASDIKALGTDKAIAGAACIVVSILGFSNAAGRVLWGFVSDRIGRIQSIMLMALLTATAMFLLPKFALDSFTLKIAAVVIGTCYGGCLGTFPSLCADTFGAKNLTINYGLLFSATSVAAITGPMVAAKINIAAGTYSTAFIVAGVVSTAALVFAVSEHVVAKKKSKASIES